MCQLWARIGQHRRSSPPLSAGKAAQLSTFKVFLSRVQTNYFNRSTLCIKFGKIALRIWKASLQSKKKKRHRYSVEQICLSLRESYGQLKYLAKMRCSPQLSTLRNPAEVSRKTTIETSSTTICPSQTWRIESRRATICSFFLIMFHKHKLTRHKVRNSRSRRFKRTSKLCLQETIRRWVWVVQLPWGQARFSWR